MYYVVLNFSKLCAFLLAFCHNPNDNTTQPQPQHCSWVGHENDYANPTTTHPTTQTQQQAVGAPDEHLLTTT